MLGQEQKSFRGTRAAFTSNKLFPRDEQGLFWVVAQPDMYNKIYSPKVE